MTIKAVDKNQYHPISTRLPNPTDAAKGTATGNGDDVFVMPTSVAQRRFWLLDQLEPGNTSLNMPLALKLNGKLDTAVLERALNEIVSRHEILRTTFLKSNGELSQVVSPKALFQLELVDVSGESDPEQVANRLMVDEAHTVFDLANGPLFKAKLVILGSEEHILLLTLHHIVCDGWSNGVLVREIGELYDAFSRGCPSPLDELPIQYADFAAWQQEWLSGGGFEEQLSYWKQSLGNELPELEFPTDFPRKKIRTSFGAIESLLLPKALTRALKALGQREDATMFMIFLVAFKILLHRYSGQDNILIGSPTANRMQSQTEEMIGAFANTLLLKTDMSGNPTFKEALSRIKDVSHGAFSNQNVPFEKLVETVRPARGSKSGQLFQVLFIFQNAFMKPLNVNGLSITPIRSVSPGSIFELSLGVVERGEGTRLQLEYNTDLFKAETVKCMLADFESILQRAVLDSDRPISDLLQWTTPIRTNEVTKTESLVEQENKTGDIAGSENGSNSQIEDALVEIWKESLELESVGVQDDFFDVGGHSLLAVQIFDEIKNRLGVKLPLATLFKATTIEQLANLIREERPKDIWTSLVPINAEGTKPPLFLMHAAGGNVLFYKDLANRMGADQPCYGLQAVGLSGHQSAYDRIEDMAAHYIKEIKGVQPKGPYYLGGSSLGGIIAYEAGKQLTASGDEVRFVALIDTYAPGYPKRIPGTSRLMQKIFDYYDQIRHHVDTLRILQSGERWPYIKAKSGKAKNQLRRRYKHTKRKIERGVISGLGRPLPEALVDTQNNILVASRAYLSSTYAGPIVLFRASRQLRGVYRDETLGWSNYAKGRFDVHEISGSHGSIVAEPRARGIAEILKKMIVDADQVSNVGING